MKYLLVLCLIVLLTVSQNFLIQAQESEDDGRPILEENLKGSKIPSKTDDEVFEREAEAMNVDGYSVAEKKLLEGEGEAHQFQAEVSRLMDLIINSLYSTREIFLRELISNASDALDKIRFESLTNKALIGDVPEFEIRIKPNPINRTLEIRDTGIGMTKEDLINNLGTIAKSGTIEFLNNQASNSDEDVGLIGQFGVGFYSAFLVAERVTVVSKNPGDNQHVWTSTSDGYSVVEDTEGEQLGRGTSIILHLRDDCDEFLRQEKIEQLVSKYSEFINFPIYLWTSHVEEREVPIEDEEDDFEEEDEGLEIEEEEEDDWEDFEIIEETVWEWKLLNEIKPLWTRDPSDVEDEEYIAFYQALSKDDQEPYSWTHFRAEGGDIDFKAILYLPSELDSNYFDTSKKTHAQGLKLYVKRVFISDNFDAVIPKYLSFIVGVIDSEHLPLNVSREILQEDKSMKLMQKKLVRKAITLMQQLSQNEPEDYEDFYDEFSVNIKLGIIEDFSNRDRLTKLLRFYSSKSGNEMVSLEDYVENMKEDQDKIFFLSGESRSIVSKSPLLEKLKSRGYEVLYFVDPIDEYWVQHVRNFDDHQLVNIGKDSNLGIDDEEDQEENEQTAEDFADLTSFLKDILSDKITKCVISSRLTTTPSALIASSYGYSANMERIMKAQALATDAGFVAPKKILEINAKHPIIGELLRRISIDEEDEVAVDIAELMFDTAALHSGYSLDNPSRFANRIHKMMKLGLGLNPDAEVEVEDFDEELEEDDSVEDDFEDEQEEQEEHDHVHDEL